MTENQSLKGKTERPVTIRPAHNNDLLGIAKCIEPFVASGKVLPRTLNELEGLIPSYVCR